MSNNFSRTEMLLGTENMAKLQAARKAKAEAKASTKAPAKKAAAKK